MISLNTYNRSIPSVSMLSSVIVLLMAGIFIFLRYPFEINYFNALKIISVALFLINIPYCVYCFNKNLENDFFQFNLKGVLLLLVFIVAAGAINFSLVIYLIMPGGICAFFFVSIHFLRKLNYLSLFQLFFTAILCFWIAGVVWGGFYLTPLFFEKIICGFYNNTGGPDTFFHISISQMLKTYNVSSTGLDELPYFPYHFGSHFIFAQFSKVLKVSVTEMYHFGVPVIFVALFFHVVFLVFHRFREMHSPGSSFNYFFWVLLFAVFLGFLPMNTTGIAYRTSFAWNSLLISESYLVSMTFFFMALSFLCSVIHAKAGKLDLKSMLFLMLLVFFIGITKISTLFIFNVILGYLFIRYKLYESLHSVVFLGLAAIISLYIFFITVDPLSPNGEIKFLSFYNKYVHSGLGIYFLLTLFWTFALLGVWLFLYINKISTSSIFAELQIVIACAGILPGMFVDMAGGSAFYFSDIQHWTAFIFIAYYSSFFTPYLKIIKLKVVYAACFLALVLCSMNGFYAFQTLIKDNYVVKNQILNKTDLTISSLRLRKIIADPFVLFDMNLNVKLDSNTDFKRLKYLASLDALEDKASKIIFIDSADVLLKYLPCYKYPFFVTGASGMCMFNGFSLKRCYYADYGVEHYTREEIKSDQLDVCRVLVDLKFKEVVHCNVAGQVSVIKKCK